MDNKKKIAFIVRGNLKNPGGFREDVSKYFQSKYEVFLKFTRAKGHATDLVVSLIEDNEVDFLVGVGGDGTFSEVVNGYMAASEKLREKTVLVTFPRGSGNDFSRTAGQVSSMKHLSELIERNETRPLDIVKTEYTENGENKVRYYDNSFDIGLGGLVCKFMNNSGKTWGSSITYFTNIVRSFFLFKRIPVELKSRDYNFKGRVLLLSLNNGKYFGNGIAVSPDAKIDDGKINLTIARKINIAHFLLYTLSLRNGKKINHKELIYKTIDECEITSFVYDCPIEMDGEVLGTPPLKIKVIKHAARLLNI